MFLPEITSRLLNNSNNLKDPLMIPSRLLLLNSNPSPKEGLSVVAPLTASLASPLLLLLLGHPSRDHNRQVQWVPVTLHLLRASTMPQKPPHSDFHPPPSHPQKCSRPLSATLTSGIRSSITLLLKCPPLAKKITPAIVCGSVPRRWTTSHLPNSVPNPSIIPIPKKWSPMGLKTAATHPPLPTAPFPHARSCTVTMHTVKLPPARTPTTVVYL